MKGLTMMLKALGINVSPEHIQMIESLLPVLPEKLNQVVSVVNNALTNFDGRLQTLEKQNAELKAQHALMIEALQRIEQNAGRKRPASAGSVTGN